MPRLLLGGISVVCSTSLEMGIDIGSIDLVIMVSAPKGVARALQRMGRSGHSMGAMTAASLLIQDARPFLGAILTGFPLEELTPEQGRQVSQGIMSLDPFYLDELENDPLKFDVANAFVHLANLFSPAVRAEVQAGLPKLQLPILLVCGDRDLICSPDLVRRWAPRIPMARERVFAETHHDLFNDASQGEVSGFIANAIIRWAEDSVDSWRKLQDVPDGRSDASGAFASTAFASSMPH